MMRKLTTIVDFFKRKNTQSLEANVSDTSSPTSDISISKNPSTKFRKVDVNEIDISSLERDPDLHPRIKILIYTSAPLDKNSSSVPVLFSLGWTCIKKKKKILIKYMGCLFLVLRFCFIISIMSSKLIHFYN
jgi:hypothetical protein